MLRLYFLFFVSLSIAQNVFDAQSATVFSLIYGYPLLAWQSYYAPVLDEVGANTWQHARELRTADDTTVVKPNVDTLYSTFVYDLSQANVEITVPEVPDDTFALFSFYDPFGDNYANIGTGGYYQPGMYLIRPYDRPGGGSDIGLQVINTFGSPGGYIASINAPSVYGTLLVRWNVNSTNADLIHGLQDQCDASEQEPPEDLGGDAESELSDLVDVYSEDSSPAENVMNLLAVFMPPDAPMDSFEEAGIEDGSYSAPDDVDLDEANSTAVTSAQDAATDPDSIVSLNNGWSVLSPDEIGIYGTNYALRAAIGISGYLALRNPFAIYPTWANSSAEDPMAPLSIGSDEAVLFTFSGKPPLQDAGFWSLTAYGSDYFLIPNDLDRYALGDESELTYSDGSPVYGDDSDGPFQLLLQAADVAPPDNWTSNWLPAPEGGGDVIAQLRFFAGQQALTDGSYDYPVVEKVPAITAGSGAGGGGGGGSMSGSASASSTSGGTSTSSGSSTASSATMTGAGGNGTNGGTMSTSATGSASSTSNTVSLTMLTGGSSPTSGSGGGNQEGAGIVLQSSLMAVISCVAFVFGVLMIVN